MGMKAMYEIVYISRQVQILLVLNIEQQLEVMKYII